MPDIFKQEVLAIVLSQLFEQPYLPTLFMRSVIQSMKAHKGLSSYINSLLTRLVAKQIWKRPKLWQGFVKAVSLNFPSSLPILLALPKEHSLDLLINAPELVTNMKEYLEGLPNHQKSRREFALLQGLIKESSNPKVAK